MARFYSIRLQDALQGGTEVVREWGRIGSAGRVRNDPYASQEQAKEAARILALRKQRKGYR